MEKILVTGSNGTVGTELCARLLDAGYEVVGADWKKNAWNTRIDEITIDIDLRNKDEILAKLPKDVDLVIHLAANARVYNLIVDPTLARDNFETMFNVLEFTRQNKVGKFLFASSREVYGNSDKVEHSEDDINIKYCESAYTASKIGGESLVYAYNTCYDMDFVVFRFSNVYGKYDGSDRVIPLFITLCNQNKDLVVFDDTKTLDFIYIEDMAKEITDLLPKFDTVKNNIFNLGYGEGVKIIDLAQMIKEEMKSNNEVRIEDNRAGEVMQYVADVSKAKEILGFSPETNIKKGVAKSVAWYRENYL